ncbi:FAD-dependent oxidoreductase [Barrientosiimonas humi]|uniref:FAD-dependent oxidoreductase n=1 Tax=Barrientosiimonas humi TaxID=999931 RepID=UPI0022A79DC1|nr:FAD-dependent oxidoreductase [Barrientosiimonas humi]
MTAAHRVVVVGHGMVAARFVDLLLTYADRTGTAVCATVLGDEPHEPYNRLMLSEVIAGRASLGGLALPRHDERVTVLTGVTGTVLHRARRRLTTDQGHEIPYDTVVLATGAEPAFPGPALTPGGGVRSLRTLDDCRDLLAVVSRRAHVTVVGGGAAGPGARVRPAHAKGRGGAGAPGPHRPRAPARHERRPHRRAGRA